MVRRLGTLLVYVRFTGTLANVVVPIHGDIGNRDLAQLPVGFRPSGNSGVPSGGTGRANAYNVNSSGWLQLTAVAPDATQTGNVTIGSLPISCSGFIILG